MQTRRHHTKTDVVVPRVGRVLEEAEGGAQDVRCHPTARRDVLLGRGFTARLHAVAVPSTEIHARRDTLSFVADSPPGSPGPTGATTGDADRTCNARRGSESDTRKSPGPGSHVVTDVIPIPDAEGRFESPDGFQLRHIGRVVLSAFPRPQVIVRRQALGHAVIVLDDRRCLLHVEVIERRR